MPQIVNTLTAPSGGSIPVVVPAPPPVRSRVPATISTGRPAARLINYRPPSGLPPIATIRSGPVMTQGPYAGMTVDDVLALQRKLMQEDPINKGLADLLTYAPLGAALRVPRHMYLVSPAKAREMLKQAEFQDVKDDFKGVRTPSDVVARNYVPEMARPHLRASTDPSMMWGTPEAQKEIVKLFLDTVQTTPLNTARSTRIFGLPRMDRAATDIELGDPHANEQMRNWVSLLMEHPTNPGFVQRRGIEMAREIWPGMVPPPPPIRADYD